MVSVCRYSALRASRRSEGARVAAVTLGLVCLILIAADAAEREHRKW
mgnify:CR=1 FL=1